MEITTKVLPEGVILFTRKGSDFGTHQDESIAWANKIAEVVLQKENKGRKFQFVVQSYKVKSNPGSRIESHYLRTMIAVPQ